MKQPRTDVRLDPPTFARLKRTVQQMSQGRQQVHADLGYASPLPLEIGLQLTNRCNLRCLHCFQWNDTGWHRQLAPAQRNQDLDLDLIAKVLQQTADARPNLYLWGGEPLSYGAWEPLARLLEDKPLWTVLCSNGIDLDRRMESILRISGHLAVLVSIDGLEAENDALRGAGSTRRTLSNVDQLLRLKQEGRYRGEISVHCVIHERIVPRLYDFVTYWEDKGINTVYLCFPWYISSTVAARMDDYYATHFSWLRELDPRAPRSWHSFQYHLPPKSVPALQEQIGRINERVWRVRVRLQPALESEEIAPYVMGEELSAQHRSVCLAVSQRMNVLPDGTVTACKLFPEFVIGDLHREDVATLWHKPAFRRAREVLHQGLMPACSRCVLLYLHGS